MRNNFTWLLYVVAVFTFNGSAYATPIFTEDFEDLSDAVLSTPLFEDGGSDYFLLSNDLDVDDDGSSATGVPSFTGFDGSFLAGEDLDGEGATLPVTVTFNNIDISGESGLSFSGLFAGTTGVDTPDFLTVSYRIDSDSGAFTELLDFRLDVGETDGFNGSFRLDTTGDDSGDGATLGLAATEITAAIPGTGSTLDIQLSVSLSAGGEEFAVDSFSVSAIPEPATALLVVLGATMVSATRVRSKRG